MQIFLIICAVLVIALSIVFILLIRKTKAEKEKLESYKQEAQKWQTALVEAQANYNSVCQLRDEQFKEITVMQDTAAALRDQADESAQAYYDEKMKTIKLKLDHDLKEEEEKFEQAKQDYEQDYLQVMAEMAQAVSQYGTTAKQLIQTIEDMASKERAAIEAAKRDMKDHDVIEFHRIQIPEQDLKEIAKIKEILPYLRDKDTLNKVIYKIYYENPTNDLIGRVVGNKNAGGIYKITNINNGMCYVGQAVNFANRWKQHIKRGVGAEPITHNKLYPAMQKEGVHNFTFEIIEECSPAKFNEREQYWQNYFGAKEFGYSIR